MDDLLSNNESQQESQLSELTTWLCIGDEDYIRNFDIHSFVPMFLALMGKSGYSGLKPVKKREIKVLAARAVGLVLDIVPFSCAQVINFGAVEVLVDLLKTNDKEVELAEEVLKCLQKIAVESPQQLLKQNNFMEILLKSVENLKTLSNTLMSPALSLISNLCRKLSSKNFKDISSSLSMLSSLFQGSEEEVLKVCDCYAFLLNNFSDDEKKIQTIASDGLVENLVARLVRASTSKNSIIKLLSLLCNVSPNVSLYLCKRGVVPTIQGTISPQYQVFDGEESLKSLISSEDMLIDVLYLLNSMLPKIYGNDLALISSKPFFEWFWEDDFHNLNKYDLNSTVSLENAFKDKSKSVDIFNKKYTVDLIQMKQFNKSSNLMRNVHRIPLPAHYVRDNKFTIENTKTDSGLFFSIVKKFKSSNYPSISVSDQYFDFLKDSKITEQLLQCLIEPLIEISTSSLNISVRQDCVMAMTKIIMLANEKHILEFLDSNQMTSFLCKIISSSKFVDIVVITHVLVISDVLLNNVNNSPYQEKLSKEEFFEKVEKLKMKEQTASIDAFLSKNNLKSKKISKNEENILKEHVNLFKKKSVNFSKLLDSFESDSFSTSQFYKSNFAKFFLDFLVESKDLRSLSNSIQFNPKSFKNLVHLINFTLDSQEQLEAVTNLSFKTNPPALANLKQCLSMKLVSQEKKKSTFTLSVEPLSSVSSLYKFLESKNINGEIYYQDQKLQPSMMCLEAIGRYSKFDYSEVWSNTHEFSYKKLSKKDEVVSHLDSLKDINQFDVIPGITSAHPSNQLLSLMKFLYFLNTNPIDKDFEKTFPIIENNTFISNQISSKIRFQLQTKESLLLCCFGKFPSWIDGITETCKFLFPFELRRLLFYSINFGASKILNKEQNSSGNSSDGRIGRENVHKETIDRSKLLEQAIQIMEKNSFTKSTLEFEYENESGIGLGPTLNFYNSVSHEIQRKKLGLFHDDDKQNQSEFVKAAHGLFPSFVTNKESLNNWKFIGQLVGKSLEDNRLLDLQFNEVFFKILLGKEFTISDVAKIDKYLFNHLKMISDLKIEKKDLKKQKEVQEKISSLYLDFSFEGVDLIKNGSSNDVSFDNFDKYVEIFNDFILNKAIKQQIESFLDGMKDIFPLHRLKYFNETELNQLICGNDEKWDINLLTQHTLTNGFTHESKTVQYLFEILVEMDEQERRDFLEFTTGSNRLPIGGLKNLNPKLSIIKSISTKKDESLPTANTCFHYFKLPEYSSKEVLKERLSTSIKFGQGFQLT